MQAFVVAVSAATGVAWAESPTWSVSRSTGSRGEEGQELRRECTVERVSRDEVRWRCDDREWRRVEGDVSALDRAVAGVSWTRELKRSEPEVAGGSPTVFVHRSGTAGWITLRRDSPLRGPLSVLDRALDAVFAIGEPPSLPTDTPPPDVAAAHCGEAGVRVAWWRRDEVRVVCADGRWAAGPDSRAPRATGTLTEAQDRAIAAATADIGPATAVRDCVYDVEMQPEHLIVGEDRWDASGCFEWSPPVRLLLVLLREFEPPEPRFFQPEDPDPCGDAGVRVSWLRSDSVHHVCEDGRWVRQSPYHGCEDTGAGPCAAEGQLDAGEEARLAELLARVDWTDARPFATCGLHRRPAERLESGAGTLDTSDTRCWTWSSEVQPLVDLLWGLGGG